MTAQQQLVREQASSRAAATKATELQQRLANLRATASQSSAFTSAAVAGSRLQAQAALQVIVWFL
jgi:hypothetical protein